MPLLRCIFASAYLSGRLQSKRVHTFRLSDRTELTTHREARRKVQSDKRETYVEHAVWQHQLCSPSPLLIVRHRTLPFDLRTQTQTPRIPISATIGTMSSSPSSPHPLVLVQSSLRSRLQALVDTCRADGAFGDGFGKDPDDANDGTNRFEWPRVDLHLKPVLLQHINSTMNTSVGGGGNAGVGRPSSSASSSSSEPPSKSKSRKPIIGDFTSHILVKLGNAWKAYIKNRNSSSLSSSPSPIVPFDLTGSLASWSHLIATRLQESLDTEPLTYDIDLQTPPPPQLSRRITVVGANGFINFFLDETWLSELMNTDTTISATVSASSSPSSSSLPPSASSSIAASATSSHLSTAHSFSFSTMGEFRSIFTEKHGTPRQGCVVKGARAWLKLHPTISRTSFDGLEEFKYVWIVFVFHANGGEGGVSGGVSSGGGIGTFTNAKVKPPRAGGKKVGLFATRSPHRPNPIGLSLARLDRIKGDTIYLSGIDLISGTPVVDIKPYHPADCVNDYRIPSWIDPLPTQSLTVVWTDTALEQCSHAFQSGTGLEFYDSASSKDFEILCTTITELISQDPRTLHSKTKHGNGSVYGICVDRMDICFRITETNNNNDTNPSSSTSSTSNDPNDSNNLPKPVATIFMVSYYPPSSSASSATTIIRPKLRTKEWLASIQPSLDAFRTSIGEKIESNTNTMEVEEDDIEDEEMGIEI